MKRFGFNFASLVILLQDILQWKNCVVW
jgi:hypothetical protein